MAKAKAAPAATTEENQTNPAVTEETKPEDSTEPEVRSFAWAATRVQNGLAVKREAWVGNKTISLSDRTGRTVLTTEDMAATDWIVA